MPQPVPCPQKAPEPLSESDQLTDTYKAPFLRLPDTSLLLLPVQIALLPEFPVFLPANIPLRSARFFQWFQFLKHMHLKSKLFSASDHLHKVSRIICLLITDYKIFLMQPIPPVLYDSFNLLDENTAANRSLNKNN